MNSVLTRKLAEQRSASALAAWNAKNAPRLPWSVFIKRFEPQPGEHTTIIGSTGRGKTVLQNAVLTKYPFVAVMATKPADIEIDRLISTGYSRFAQWLPLNPLDTPRRVIWPDARRLDSVDTQKRVFAHALDSAFREGGRPKHKPVGWAIAIDELRYFVDMLSMSKELRLLLMQGRSVGVSLIGATQRPAHVPLEVYNQATHLFFFRETDGRNLDRISEINHADSNRVQRAVQGLEPFQAFYVNTKTGEMARTRTPKPKEATK